MKTRLFALSGLAAAAALLSLAANSAGADEYGAVSSLSNSTAGNGYTVPMDQGRIITFPEPISSVFVGNPLIADITVIDNYRVFLTGKNMGSTNLVALDTDGNQMSNDRINVYTRQNGTAVTLFRGTAQTSLACAGGRCATSVLPGDEYQTYQDYSPQPGARNDILRSAAGGQGGGQ